MDPVKRRDERENIGDSSEQHLLRLVRRLLVEELDPVEIRELDYQVFSRWHLGVVAQGGGAKNVLSRVKAALGCELLCVPDPDGCVLAWLGGQSRLSIAEIEQWRLPASGHDGVILAVGEPWPGIEGWRQTHHEARAALRAAPMKAGRIVRYGDAPLLMSVLGDEVAKSALTQLYLSRLGSPEGGKGAVWRRTLWAYFATGHDVAATAEALKAGRRTIERHLHEIEEVFGPLCVYGTVLEIALAVEQLCDGASADGNSRAI